MKFFDSNKAMKTLAESSSTSYTQSLQGAYCVLGC
jgi:hypothetical protein